METQTNIWVASLLKPTCNFFSKIFLLSISIFFLHNDGKAQFSCTGLTPTNISYTGAVQTFTVPAGVSQVRISLTGASGGQASASTNMAGGGANVYAYVSVIPGDIFRVIIGQKGTNGVNEAGGGGSSAIYKNGILIMVAGGGGGEDNTGNGGNGLASTNGGNGGSDASVSSTGGCGTSPNNGKGGASGNGGNHGEFSANCPNGGGGGGGLNSPGQGNGSLNSGQPGGQGNINGTTGGAGSLDDAPAIIGGWGWSGGGGADDRESGGGGGYSGGGGGPESMNPGGGGSFVAGIGTNGITQSGKTDGTGTATGHNGSAIVCSSPAITLPVIFAGFTADAVAEGVLLKWTSSSEINTKHFDVEKSTDGRNFSVVGTVAATGGNGIEMAYQFTDRLNSNGKLYYRIRVVDFDGKISYSAIRTVNGQEELSLNIYPNPVKDKISIQLPANWRNGSTRLLFINASGQIVLKKTTTVLQNDINISMLPSGVYLIKATSSKFDQQFSVRFIK